VDYEKITPILKEKMGDDAPEEIPFEIYCNYFNEEIKKLDEGRMLVFDGWRDNIPELKKLIEVCGSP